MLADYVEALKTVLIPPQPTTRAESLKYSCDLTPDPQIQVNWMHWSEGKGTTIGSQIYTTYDKPAGFYNYHQFLSQEILPGRCYWEVKWSGNGASVAVVYANTRREPGLCEQGFGISDKSKTTTSFFTAMSALLPPVPGLKWSPS